MSTPLVFPISIRRALRPGDTAIQNFTVNIVPSGTIVATLEGRNPFTRLLGLTAAEQIKERLTDEEFAQLPPDKQDEEHRFATRVVEVGRAGPGQDLAVRPAFHVEGEIEFVAPADAEPTSANATLVVKTSTGRRSDVPVVFVIGELQVDFLDQPVVARRGQEVLVAVRLTPSPGTPPAELILDSREPFFSVRRQDVSISGGESTAVEVALFTDAVTPLGPRSTNLRVDGFSGLATNFPFDVVVEDPR